MKLFQDHLISVYFWLHLGLSWSWIFRDESQYESFIKRQKYDEDEPQDVKTEFALLAVAMRSGHVIIWKNLLPLESK